MEFCFRGDMGLVISAWVRFRGSLLHFPQFFFELVGGGRGVVSV